MHDVVAADLHPTDAFAQALNTLQWPLVGFVRGLVRDEEQARDIVQDVFSVIVSHDTCLPGIICPSFFAFAVPSGRIVQRGEACWRLRAYPGAPPSRL